MKAKNLKILKENNINVPNFFVTNVENIDITNFTKTYAIRSSCSFEDGEFSSFAGQFDTYLNIKPNEINTYIKKVKHSYRNKNVETYAKQKNISIDEIEKNMNIIVQEMIDADLSGIMFTSNPIGILNEIVIVIGKGLGNNVVEDKIDTTTYYYNKDDEIFYYEQNNSSPLIENNVFLELIDNANKIEKIFDQPMDIEFAIKDNVVYILQARPITTLKQTNPIILDNSNIVESYPDISLPLTQSFVKEIYYRVFETLLLRISDDDRLVSNMNNNLKNMTDIANGRIYYRISNWYEVLHLLPFSKKIIPMWQKMLGVNNKTIPYPTTTIPISTKFNIVFSFVKYLVNTPKHMKELNLYFEEKLPLYEKSILEAKNNSDTKSRLLVVYYNIKEDLTSKWDITLINDMYTFIYTALCNKKYKSLVSNIKNIESMKPIISINNLVIIAQKAGINSKEYKKEKEKHINLYGDRCLQELKLETKTYRTNPELVDEYVMQHINEPQNIQSINEKDKNSNKNIFFKNAKKGIFNREISRMNRTRIFGLTREIFLSIGETFVKQELLENKEDIFYLYFDEIQEDNRNYKSLVNERKILYENYKNLPAYSRLVFDEKIINKTNFKIKSNILNNSDVLQGTPTSNGIIKGEVLIIDNPNQNIDTNNKIIITKTTDPGWVFLIEKAKGIIAEKGSILSHTAIITRELKKPSIVNVKDATIILKNGDFIEMDATNGIVKILNRKET